MEWSPKHGDVSVFQQFQIGGYLVYILHHQLILAARRIENLAHVKGCLVTFRSPVEGVFAALVGRYIPVPHDGNHTTLAVPLTHLADVGIVYPSSFRRERMVDIVEAVQRRPFAGMLMHPLGFVQIPVDAGHRTRDGLLPFNHSQTLQQLHSLSRMLLCLLSRQTADD